MLILPNCGLQLKKAKDLQELLFQSLKKADHWHKSGGYELGWQSRLMSALPPIVLQKSKIAR